MLEDDGIIGHTALMVAHCFFIFGDRENPTRILNDLWFVNTDKLKWNFLEFNGVISPARHQHDVVVLDSCIYVFGGVLDATIYGGDFNLCFTKILLEIVITRL